MKTSGGAPSALAPSAVVVWVGYAQCGTQSTPCASMPMSSSGGDANTSTAQPSAARLAEIEMTADSEPPMPCAFACGPHAHDDGSAAFCPE